VGTSKTVGAIIKREIGLARHTRLSGVGSSAHGLVKLWRREAGALELADGLSVLHETLRLLCGTSASGRRVTAVANNARFHQGEV
jgi:hypothetical protein